VVEVALYNARQQGARHAAALIFYHFFTEYLL
jgi:hypothetical protein